MRGTMDGDVAAERQLIAVERLLARMPRSRGFRVSADGTVSVYTCPPPNSRTAASYCTAVVLCGRDVCAVRVSGQHAANLYTRHSVGRA